MSRRVIILGHQTSRSIGLAATLALMAAHAPRRCKTSEVASGLGECMACSAANGEACRSVSAPSSKRQGGE